MQTLIQVYCTRGPSLREKIADDQRIERYRLSVSRELQPGRSPGWMKVHSTEPDRRGAINVVWDGGTHLLSCRVVTRGAAPDLIVGDFLAYLFARHRRRIQSITVVPR